MSLPLACKFGAVHRKLVTSVARREFSALLQLEFEYPGLPTLSPQPAKATSISVSTLSNGLRVVTEDASATSTVTLTFPKAGSSNETLDEQGAALVNRCMNFMSGSGLSTLLINRTIEDAGGTPFSSVSRHCAVVGYSVVAEKAVPLIPLLATDCTFEKWDMRDAKKLAAVVSKVANESNEMVLTENLYAAAYGPQSPGGRPLYWPGCSNDTMKAFRARTYGLNGSVLAATGIKDHGAFCAEVENLLSESPVGNADSAAPMAYLGGESRVMQPGKRYAHVALAFPGPHSSVLANVVAQFLNLASGKSGVSALAVPGLAGVYAGSDSPGTIVEAMCKTLKTSPTPDLVKRAKNRAKAEALFALDGGNNSLASFMTSSVLESQILTGPNEVIKAYDAVTDKQVADALTSMLKSNPSLAAVGDIALVPYQATVAAMLK